MPKLSVKRHYTSTDNSAIFSINFRFSSASQYPELDRIQPFLRTLLFHGIQHNDQDIKWAKLIVNLHSVQLRVTCYLERQEDWIANSALDMPQLLFATLPPDSKAPHQFLRSWENPRKSIDSAPYSTSCSLWNQVVPDGQIQPEIILPSEATNQLLNQNLVFAGSLQSQRPRSILRLQCTYVIMLTWNNHMSLNVRVSDIDMLILNLTPCVSDRIRWEE